MNFLWAWEIICKSILNIHTYIFLYILFLYKGNSGKKRVVANYKK